MAKSRRITLIDLESAFNYIISLKGRPMMLHDLESGTKVTFKIAKSNYFRNLDGLEEMNIKGREFVISKKLLDASSLPNFGENIRIIDSDNKSYTITEIHEMEGLGTVLGYRVRTS